MFVAQLDRNRGLAHLKLPHSDLICLALQIPRSCTCFNLLHCVLFCLTLQIPRSFIHLNLPHCDLFCLKTEVLNLLHSDLFCMMLQVTRSCTPVNLLHSDLICMMLQVTRSCTPLSLPHSDVFCLTRSCTPLNLPHPDLFCLTRSGTPLDLPHPDLFCLTRSGTPLDLPHPDLFCLLLQVRDELPLHPPVRGAVLPHVHLHVLLAHRAVPVRRPQQAVRGRHRGLAPQAGPQSARDQHQGGRGGAHAPAVAAEPDPRQRHRRPRRWRRPRGAGGFWCQGRWRRQSSQEFRQREWEDEETAAERSRRFQRTGQQLGHQRWPEERQGSGIPQQQQHRPRFQGAAVTNATAAAAAVTGVQPPAAGQPPGSFHRHPAEPASPERLPGGPERGEVQADAGLRHGGPVRRHRRHAGSVDGRVRADHDGATGADLQALLPLHAGRVEAAGRGQLERRPTAERRQTARGQRPVSLRGPAVRRASERQRLPGRRQRDRGGGSPRRPRGPRRLQLHERRGLSPFRHGARAARRVGSQRRSQRRRVLARRRPATATDWVQWADKVLALEARKIQKVMTRSPCLSCVWRQFASSEVNGPSVSCKHRTSGMW